jgi:acetylornithine deacetylase/succinyl-diaminopimelate desuccinylase-like protein
MTKYNGNFSLEINPVKRQTPFLESYEVDSDNLYLKTLKKSVLKVTKKTVIPYFRSSVADENIFGAKGITTLGIGPCGGNAHAANEWVSIASVNKLSHILSHFLSYSEMI